MAYVAFFDDSGSSDPDRAGEVYVLGSVVLQLADIKAMTDEWWALLKRVAKLSAHPPKLGIEIKWTDLNQVVRGGRVRPELAVLSLTPDDARAAIDNILGWLATYPGLIFVACAFHTGDYWRGWHPTDYAEFVAATGPRKRELREKLSAPVRSKTFEWGVLERVSFTMDDLGGTPCILIGDKGNAQAQWHREQDGKQKIRSQIFTDAPFIVSNVVFGDSMFSPGLQIADWISCAVRQWALGRDADMLARLRGRFRDYATTSRYVARGGALALKPSGRSFPPVPVYKKG